MNTIIERPVLGALLTRDDGGPATLEALNTRRDSLLVEARGLIEAAGDTDLEGEAATRYDAIETELEQLKKRRGRLELLARHMGSGSTEGGDGANGWDFQHQRTADPYDMATPASFNGDDMRARAASAIDATRGFDDSFKARATELLETIDTEDGALARHIIATGRPEYRKAFIKLATGRVGELTERERESVILARAASLSDSAGGYAVPFTLDPTLIITNDGTTNPFRQISRVVTTVTDQWQGVTTAGVTASWDAEAAEVSDDAPTLAAAPIPVYKAQAFVPFSVEVGGDWANIEADLRMAIADGKDRLEGTAFATGDGSGKPTGIIAALTGVSGSITASAGADTFAIADVYAVSEGIGPRYRPNAQWVSNLSIINKMRQFGTANNYHGFLTDLAGDTPRQLLGRPIHESSDMDGTYGSGENYVLVYGDWRHYVIVDRVGMSVELVPHLFGDNNRPTGQRGIYAFWRTGADSVNDAAFQMLNVT